MKAVLLLAVVVIVFQSQLVSADPLALLPITSITGVVNTLATLLVQLLRTVLGYACTVVDALVGTLESLLPMNVKLVGSLLCDGTERFPITAVFQVVGTALFTLLSLVGIPQLLAAITLPLALGL